MKTCQTCCSLSWVAHLASAVTGVTQAERADSSLRTLVLKTIQDLAWRCQYFTMQSCALLSFLPKMVCLSENVFCRDPPPNLHNFASTKQGSKMKCNAQQTRLVTQLAQPALCIRTLQPNAQLAPTSSCPASRVLSDVVMDLHVLFFA